ncbi:unnamed protein product [Symbiodinium sp. CCMP2456]|nr:unnamed protein product [Symbiodinium sp. CCMP2456]
MGTDGPPSVVNLIQSALNHTRKTEQRVSTVARNKKERAMLWDKYHEDMKVAYAREHARYLKDMEKLEQDLEKALIEQEVSRRALLDVHTNGAPTIAKEEDTKVDRMFEAWRNEEQDDAQGILQRALTASAAQVHAQRQAGQGVGTPTFGGAPPSVLDSRTPRLRDAGGSSRGMAAYASDDCACMADNGEQSMVGAADELAQRLAVKRAMEPFGGAQADKVGPLNQINPTKPPVATLIDDDDTQKDKDEHAGTRKDGNEGEPT